jgi:hypothetical protein
VQSRTQRSIESFLCSQWPATEHIQCFGDTTQTATRTLGRVTNRAIERRQMLSQIIEIEALIDVTKQMI